MKSDYVLKKIVDEDAEYVPLCSFKQILRMEICRFFSSTYQNDQEIFGKHFDFEKNLKVQYNFRVELLFNKCFI